MAVVASLDFMQWLTVCYTLVFIAWMLFLNMRKPKGMPIRWPMLEMLPGLFVSVAKGNMHDWFASTVRECKTFLFKGPTRSMSAVITADPGNVEYILNKKFQSFPKGPTFRSAFRELNGDGILNADGETWSLQRKIAVSHFNSSSGLRKALESIQKLARQKLLAELHEKAKTRTNFDLQELLVDFTFASVCHMGFHMEPGVYGEKFSMAFQKSSKATALRFLTPKPVRRLLGFLGVGIDNIIKSSSKPIDEFLFSIVSSHKYKKLEADLLSLFLEAETGYMSQKKRVFTDKFLRDVCMNFILAGRDTTSVALTWFFCLLLQNPEAEEKILEEVRGIISRSASKSGTHDLLEFDKEQLSEMNYLQASLSESMRLYPPIPLQRKQAAEDEVLPDGTVMKNGDVVFISVYAMGRMESVWGSEWERFMPERWLNGKGEFVAQSAYKYPVFNAGPRMCLGMSFAYMQMKYVVASVLVRYRLCWQGLHDVRTVRAQVGFNLCMSGGLPIRLEPR